MLKPGHLRHHLTEANPALRRNPDRLHVFAERGRVVATGASSLSFEYQYTLNIIVTEYAGHADAIIVPLLAWARVHQPDLVLNDERRKNGLRFDVEFLNQQAVDLSIEIDLTERVLVSRDDTGRLVASHVGEPPDPNLPLIPEEVELWARDELLATWRIEAAL